VLRKVTHEPPTALRFGQVRAPAGLPLGLPRRSYDKERGFRRIGGNEAGLDSQHAVVNISAALGRATGLLDQVIVAFDQLSPASRLDDAAAMRSLGSCAIHLRPYR
jgi:hypothetical protein